MSHRRFTLQAPHRYELEVRRSRFVAQATPLASLEVAPVFLQTVQDLQATHNCWAYKLGSQYRFSDDGEPAGTAGRPILSAIEAQDLDKVMVVVTRYFGGIKLGAGGLVRAYAGVAAECLRQAPKQAIVPRVRCLLRAPFEFSHLIYQLSEGLERQAETYSVEGLCMQVVLEEEKLPFVQARLRDLTRGRATLQLLDHLE